VDLRRSAPPSSLPDFTLAIPAPRRPLPALTRGPRQGSPRESLFGQRATSARTASALRMRHFLNVARGSLLLVGLYMLIGAGIGDAAGSVMVGVAAGLIAGVCAVAAILLISGSALTARSAADRSPRGVSQAR
jgi:hypothetical protein